MQCLILAGGLATRMRPLTGSTPKALLPVAGRPFVEYQLEWLAAAGFDSAVLSVGFLGEQIEAHVGDGNRFGIRVEYCREGDNLRGTGGALRLAIEAGILRESFAVTYGDSYLQIDPGAMMRAFESQERPAMMSVYRNSGRHDTSNVVLGDGFVRRYDKSAAAAGEAGFDYIDYGLLAFTREIVIDRIPKIAKVDLAAPLGQLAADGLLAAFEADRRFYEIGSPAGLSELDELLARRR